MSKEQNDTMVQRRRFLTGLGLAATGSVVASAVQAADTPHAAHATFTPARHPEDAWLEERGGVHRAFIDSSSGGGGIGAMNFAANLLSAHADGYGGSDEDYSLIVCFRHDSSPFGFNDAMWEKYGSLFSRRTGVRNGDSDEPVQINPLTVANSPYGNRSNTVESLRARGIRFAVCNMSTRGMAGMLARSTGTTADAVYQELASNLIPAGRLVPAGVLAATRAQEYGYSLLFSAGI